MSFAIIQRNQFDAFHLAISNEQGGAVENQNRLIQKMNDEGFPVTEIEIEIVLFPSNYETNDRFGNGTVVENEVLEDGTVRQKTSASGMYRRSKYNVAGFYPDGSKVKYTAIPQGVFQDKGVLKDKGLVKDIYSFAAHILSGREGFTCKLGFNLRGVSVDNPSDLRELKSGHSFRSHSAPTIAFNNSFLLPPHPQIEELPDDYEAEDSSST